MCSWYRITRIHGFFCFPQVGESWSMHEPKPVQGLHDVSGATYPWQRRITIDRLDCSARFVPRDQLPGCLPFGEVTARRSACQRHAVTPALGRPRLCGVGPAPECPCSWVKKLRKSFPSDSTSSLTEGVLTCTFFRSPSQRLRHGSRYYVAKR